MVSSWSHVLHAQTPTSGHHKPKIQQVVMQQHSIFYQLFLLICLHSCEVASFAVSSSSSSNKKLLTNQKKSKGGFAKAEQAPPKHAPDTSPETANLVAFLLSQKSKGIGKPESGSEIGFSDDGKVRGLYATKAFKKGELVFQIPSDCALALSDPALGGDDVPSLAYNGRNFLEFYQNNPSARQMWAPYLDTLPSTANPHFDATPDLFTDEEIEELEFPRAVQAALQRRSEVSKLAKAEKIPLEDLQYATWIAASRSYQLQMATDEPSPEGIVSKPRKEIRVLVPYLDMINHSSDNPNAELHLIDPEKDDAWFALGATRNIRPGKEITTSYLNGIGSSVEILLNYGFVPEENKMDKLMLKKGGEDAIEGLDGWKTTIEEDEKALETAVGNMRKVLQLRIKLKKAYE